MNLEQQPKLESWKEIAAYLQRDVKTAHRWEKTEGLPVHRHSHKSRSSVYAYPAEVDAWRASRKAVPEPVLIPLWKRPAFAAAMALSLVMAGSLVRPQEVEARQEKQTLTQACEGEACNGVFLSPSGKLVRPKTTGTGAAFSPDGSKIAYTKQRGPFNRESASEAEVVVARADGTDPRTIYRGAEVYVWSSDGKRLLVGTLPADKPTNVTQLGWLDIASATLQPLPTVRANLDIAMVSHDGKYVAFNASAPGDTEENVYIMAADGSGETLVSPSAAYQEPLGWTQDGILVFGQWAHSTKIWAVRVTDGKVSKPVKTSVEFAKGVQIVGMARSGSLFYRTASWGVNDLFTVELDETGKVGSRSVPVPLPLESAGNATQARWSPDSSKLAYVHRGNRSEMYVFSFETGKEQQIAPVSSGEHCWSRDGSAIFFNERGTGVRFDLATGRKTPMFGDDKFRLANCRGDLVLVRVGHGIAERRMRVDSQRELYRTSVEAGTTTPVISHDGRRVAYLTPGAGADVPSDQSQLHVLPVGGGLVRNLVTEKAPAQLQGYWGLDWSADDRYVYYLRRADEKSPYELMRVPAAGGVAEPVGLKREDICELDVAPNGKRIVFSVCVANRPGIWELKGFLPRK